MKLPLFFLLVTISLQASANCQTQGTVKWFGLYNDKMLEWMNDSTHTTPMVTTLEVRSGPSKTSPIIGEIIISASPEHGLSAKWKSKVGSAIDLHADVFDGDFGYGPYFDFTLQKTVGNWGLLARNPLPDPSWLDLSQLSETPPIKTPTEGIYVFGEKSIVILEETETTLSFRDEQDSDMACDGSLPDIKPFKVQTLKNEQLFDSNCHIKLKVKYTRGC